MAFVLIGFILSGIHTPAFTQCITNSGSIYGVIFNDLNINGINDDEARLSNTLIKVYDSEGSLIGQSISDIDGYYQVDGLIDGNQYRVDFVSPSDFSNTLLTDDSRSQRQFVEAPACNVSLGLFEFDIDCTLNPPLILSCFVQGVPGINDMLETLIKLEHNFDSNSVPAKIANKSETGSVWGVAWDAKRNRIFSSAFVKQHAHLSAYGLDAIFATTLSAPYTTYKWINLSDLGINTGESVYSFNDCDYGNQVGRIGIGSIAVDATSDQLYAVDIYNNQIVGIEISSPTPQTTSTYPIPELSCNGGEHVPFALKMYEGKLYVGTTCTAEYSKLEEESTANVFELDPATGAFRLIFQTNYIKGYWYDGPSEDYQTMHWLTDIDFTDEGNMLLSLTDRIGHTYCNGGTSRLDFQNPDLLTVWNNNGSWELESNAKAGPLTGSGQNNGQGPDGGEFFSWDFWLSGPDYHPETALGSIYTLPGTGEVIASVYDPIYDSYSGGLHRYVTADGSKSAAIQLYTRENQNQFGKATGFGNITSVCERPPAEIGDYVWNDEDGDGIQDASEKAFAGVSVLLLNAHCQVVATTTTDKNGQYAFNNSNVDNDHDGHPEGLILDETYYITLDFDLYNSNTQSYYIQNTEYIPCTDNIMSIDNSDWVSDDVPEVASNCSLLDSHFYIPVTVDVTNTINHNFDIGLCNLPEKVFDLALINTLLSDQYVQMGDTAIFEVIVENQGTSSAKDITIVDYLTDGFSFIPNMNPNWIQQGNLLKSTLQNTLKPNEVMRSKLYLKVLDSGGMHYTNYAEIGHAIDLTSGTSGLDIDSTADEDVSNDAGGEPNSVLSDNVLDGDGIIDEDDHDPERVMIMDLALKNELKFPNIAYKAGDHVPYMITVYNQGTEEATNIEIVDFVPSEHLFLPEHNNEGWKILENEMVLYEDSTSLMPGESRQYEIVLTIKENISSGEIVNVAEIANSQAVNNDRSMDFDSKPDRVMSNDIGGQPNTNNDNRIDDNGTVDEDDSDPAALRIDFFDLALIHTTPNETVLAGDSVHYTISVINQGSITANNITVYNHIPDGMILADDDWTYLNDDPTSGIAQTVITRTGGLSATHSISVDLTLILSTDATNAEYITIAEIFSAQDLNGVNRSADDVDSTPDGIATNDMGGVAGSSTDNEINGNATIDEDDHDPARVLLVVSQVNPQNLCLDNATNVQDGQYQDRIIVSSLSGESWYISSVVGFYDVASAAPPAAPIDFVTGSTGTMLTESVIGNGRSNYSLDGIHVDNQGYQIILTNGKGTFETFNSDGAIYVDPLISGSLAACTGSVGVMYNTTEIVGATYSWSLSGGGTITSPTDGSSILVDWTAVNGVFDLELTVSSPGICYAPAVAPISIGSLSSSLSCVGDLNLSLGSQCSLIITPEMILSSPVNPSAAYAVILMDGSGNVIPNATLTSEHINTPIMVKVLDGCNSNSCWSVITLDDKVAPVIECQDITISCNGMLYYTGPIATDNCDGNVSVTLIDETIQELNCHATLAKTITRQYQATDASGNQSAICSINIAVERLNFANIVQPDDFMVSNNTNLICGSYPLDTNGGPSTEITGLPTIDGQSIYPTFSNFCNVVSVYNDLEIKKDNCSRKIERTWTIYEATCSSNTPLTYIQTIEVQDVTAPMIECPVNMTVSTTSLECMASVMLPSLSIYDECSDINNISVDVQYPNGFLDNQNGGLVSLPVGIHTITYIAYDECLNSSSCSMSLQVVDQFVPTTICQTNTAVGLNTGGEAVVFASVFDNGSFDDCSLDRFEALRVDGGAPCGDGITDYNNVVRFCCNDVGTPVTVLMRAYDAAGNYNECMVTVNVQDKNIPILTLPIDMTIACSDIYDLDDLSPYGNASVSDACGATVSSIATLSVDQCRVGTIVRTFTATDGANTIQGIQTISIEDSDPFDPLTDITWPENYTSSSSCEGSQLAPEDLPEENGFPILRSGACDLLGVSYRDQYFQYVSDSDVCFNIVRKWSVIDWCRSTTGSIVQTDYEQIISITNTDAPSFVGAYDVVEFDVIDENCQGNANVLLQATATDICTPDEFLNWSYTIDAFSDGLDLVKQSGTSATATASGSYPIGNHTIEWIFEDGCGNQTSLTQSFNVLNKKAPVVYCIDGLSITLEAVDTDLDGVVDNEMVSLHVSALDGGSYHTCGLDINISFSEDVNDDIKTFGCLDIGTQDVELWVTDSDGNAAFCTAQVAVMDNNDVDFCRDPKECITFPADTIRVPTCDLNLDPTFINSIPTVTDDCICTDYSLSYVDSESLAQASCESINRTWTVTYNCGNSPLRCNFDQTILLLNQEAPVINCENLNIEGNATFGSCNGEIVVDIPDVSAECTEGYTITNNSIFALSNIGPATGTYPVGVTEVMYTVTDLCGNSSTCSVNVTVIDVTPPVCDLVDISLTLINNEVTFSPQDVDNGTTDECLPHDFRYEVEPDPSTFTCDNVGVNIVLVTIFDKAGNSCSANVNVTVLDDVAPVCNIADITVQLTEESLFTLDAFVLDNGSFDSCGNDSDLSFSAVPSTFNCTNIGDNEVTVTVTDLSNNTSVCTTTVTTIDRVAPVCILQDITISVGADDSAIIDASSLDNGSSDVCGQIVSFSASPSSLSCDQLGDNEVTVTVTDNSGNTSVCQATVTLIESRDPVCRVNDIEVILNSMGQITIDGSELDNGSTAGCNNEVTLSVNPSSFDCANIGENLVTVIVSDNSGNTSSCTAMVSVRDTIAPICITRDITIDALDNTSLILDALTLDNGSSDDCGSIVSFASTPETLDCMQAGDNEVILTVTDNGGNTATNIAIVTVVDRTVPICEVRDITLDLGINAMAIIDSSFVDNGSRSGCDGILLLSLSRDTFSCVDIGENLVTVTATDDNGNSSTCTAVVTVRDPNMPTITCPQDMTLPCDTDVTDMSVFGMPTIDNTCESYSISEIAVADLDECNAGIIVRTFTAINDIDGSILNCSQIITISEPENRLSLEDINFPADTVIISNCASLMPVDIPEGELTINRNNLDCSSISISFTDFDSTPIANCATDTLIRTFTVIDSCQLDESNANAGVFTFTQRLFISDTFAPVITGPADITIIESNSEISLPITFVDCNNVSVNNDSPFAMSSDGSDASGKYPVGETVVNVTATDACNLTSNYQFTVTVLEDNTAPTIECKNVALEISESQLINYLPIQNVCTLSDNGTDSTAIQLAFERINSLGVIDTVNRLLLTCEDLTDFTDINIIATDLAGNVSKCSTGFSLIDLDNNCSENLTLGFVEGLVTTEDENVVSNVRIHLEGSDFEDIMTDEFGSYAFPLMPMGGAYTVEAERNDNAASGISTLDVIAIQRHVLGIDSLESPYQYIAADINDSRTISGIDIIELRKVLLGIQTEFPNNNSWRLLNKNYKFESGKDPLDHNFEEYVRIDSLVSETSADFIGVKIGDVNASWSEDMFNLDAFELRNAKVMPISITELDNESLSILANESINAYGFQMALEIPFGAIVENVTSDFFDVSIGNWTLHEGTLKVSITSPYLVNIEEGDKLLNIIGSNTLSAEFINLDQAIMIPELYDENLEARILNLEKVENTSFKVFQNEPNPWSDYTTIEFHLPTDQVVKLKVYDANAKLVFTTSDYYPSGYNATRIHRSDLNRNGIYYVEFQLANGLKQSIKMIVIQ